MAVSVEPGRARRWSCQFAGVSLGFGVGLNASSMASATFLAIPNSLIILEMTKPPPWTWKVVASLPLSRCTVASAAADCLTFRASWPRARGW